MISKHLKFITNLQKSIKQLNANLEKTKMEMS